jgi:hypothetical protein
MGLWETFEILTITIAFDRIYLEPAMCQMMCETCGGLWAQAGIAIMW